MSIGSRFLNRPRVILDQTLTPANAIDKAAQGHPERRLFHFEGPSGYRMLAQSPTVREIHAFVVCVSKCLAQAGMKRYERVLIYKTNSLDYFFLALAVIRAGGIAVPVNSGMPLDKLRHYVTHTGATIFISDAEHFAKMIGPNALPNIRMWLFPDIPRNFASPAISINEMSSDGPVDDPGPVSLATDDVVMIVHTSGTTGFPKGVMSTSSSLTQGIKRHLLGEPISSNDRIAVAGHFSHLVCQLGLFTSLMGNIAVWALTDLSPASLLAKIEAMRINIFFAFPDIYLGMYLHGLDGHDLSSVKVWIATADASHQIHMQAFCRKGALLKLWGRKLMGAVFIEPLGTSEVGFAAVERFFFPWTKLRPSRCIGWRALGGPNVQVANQEGNSLPDYTTGRLMVKGPTLFRGYWNDHDHLLGTVKNGWWWTGDIVYRDWLGRYYHMDRQTDVIQTLKGDVYSLPAEECILHHPGIGEVAVIGVERSGLGTLPVAIVQAKPGAAVEAADVLRWANQRLQTATPLAEVIMVEPTGIPRGLTGKVLKCVLREHYASYFAGSGSS